MSEDATSATPEPEAGAAPAIEAAVVPSADLAPAVVDEAVSVSAQTTPAAEAGADARAVTRRAGVVGLGTLVSRGFGFLRDVVLASEFDRAATDAFFVAFTIPNALRQLFGEGAMSASLVPMLSAHAANGEHQRSLMFFRRARAVTFLMLLVVTVLGVVFAPQVALLFVGSDVPPEVMARTTMLTRIVFPYIFFMGSAAFGAAALQTKNRFWVTSFAPLLLNVALILASLALAPAFAARGIDPALALAWGALVGGFLQWSVQWPSLRQIGFWGFAKPTFADREIKLWLSRMMPVTFGLGVYYIDLVLSRRLLAGAGTGAQSYFTWAMRVCDLPQGVLVLALSTAALPSLSAAAASGRNADVRATFLRGMRVCLLVVIPASVLLIVLAHPLVVAFFQRNHFTAEDAQQTANALMAQALGMAFVTAVRQMVPVFHAHGDTRTPVWVSAVDLAAFVGLAVLLRAPFGHVGVGLAVSGSSVVQALLLGVMLKRHLPGGGIWGAVARTVAIDALGATLAGFGAWGAARAASHLAGGLLPALAGGLVFVLLYLGYVIACAEPETESLIVRLRARVLPAKAA